MKRLYTHSLKVTRTQDLEVVTTTKMDDICCR